MSSKSNRYSDADLAEFKNLITRKVEKATNDIAQMQEQMIELNESLSSSTSDMGENSSADIDFIKRMINRQKKHLNDLENALIRINNKRYGICTLTGELIDKKRLMAVPTTTKSVAAKLANKNNKFSSSATKRRKPSKEAKIESKIIRKKTPKVAPEIKMNEEEDELFLSEEIDMPTELKEEIKEIEEGRVEPNIDLLKDEDE